MEEAKNAIYDLMNDNTLGAVEAFLCVLTDLAGSRQTNTDFQTAEDLIITIWEMMRDYNAKAQTYYSTIHKAICTVTELSQDDKDILKLVYQLDTFERAELICKLAENVKENEQ